MIPYFDAHCDTIAAIARHGGGLLRNHYHVDLERLSAYAPRAQVFALFGNIGARMQASCKTEQEFLDRVLAGEVVPDENASALYQKLLSTFQNCMNENAGRVLHCRTAADIDRAAREGKTAALLAVEGAELLYGLTPDDAYRDGVRIVTLTWNYANHLGGSCVTGGGLTEAGRAFVRRANTLGMVIDVSHGSDELFFDVAETSSAPFLASHSNSRSVHPHRRNLTDEQFRMLVKKGGVAGINLYAAFLSDGTCRISNVIRHIEHFLSLDGEGSVCLGGDLDGCQDLPEGIAGVQDIFRLADELARLGYADSLIHDIFYNNLSRVLRAVIG